MSRRYRGLFEVGTTPDGHGGTTVLTREEKRRFLPTRVRSLLWSSERGRGGRVDQQSGAGWGPRSVVTNWDSSRPKVGPRIWSEDRSERKDLPPRLGKLFGVRINMGVPGSWVDPWVLLSLVWDPQGLDPFSGTTSGLVSLNTYPSLSPYFHVPSTHHWCPGDDIPTSP